MNKNGIFRSNLIRPIAKLLVPEKKRHFPLYYDPHTDNWNDFGMNGEKVTINDDKYVFKNSGKIFTLGGYVVKITTDYKLNTTDSWMEN